MNAMNNAATAANDVACDASDIVDDATALIRAALAALLLTENSIDPPVADTQPEVHAIYVARLQLEADCIDMDEGSAAGDFRRTHVGLIRVGDAAALLSIAASSLAKSDAPAERVAARALRVAIASVNSATNAARAHVASLIGREADTGRAAE